MYHRFFAPKPVLTEAEIRRFTTVDHVDRVGLVAELRGELVAVASYDRLPDLPHEAKVAVVVSDRHQGRGVGTVLLEHLAAAAREHGITRFVAETLAENHKMLEVFRYAGFDERTHLDHGVVRVDLKIEPSVRALAAMEQREHRAESCRWPASSRPRPSPSSEPAGTRPTPATRCSATCWPGGFVGPVYPVNPSAPHVASVKAYPTVLDVPDTVDLAVVAVPSAAVLEVIRQCGEKGSWAWSCSRPASGRWAPPAPPPSGSCGSWPAITACASSAPTASAW